MAETARKVWAHILAIGVGNAFATADLLHLDQRGNVDRNLCRLVKSRKIVRLADGVFYLPGPDCTVPGTREIAKAKGRAFMKKVCPSDKDPQKFFTDSCRSSFRTVHGRVHWQHKSPRGLSKQTKSAAPDKPETMKQQTESSTDTQQPAKSQNSEQHGRPSLFNLIGKMQELIARTELRLTQLSLQKKAILHSMAIQFF